MESLSVEEIERNLNICRYRLYRSFKMEKGMTPEEYIGRIKIHRAASLIHDRPELTIKEIAEKMGYNNYDYFSRIFKKYFGTTPGKY